MSSADLQGPRIADVGSLRLEETGGDRDHPFGVDGPAQQGM
jgi:hypothetical protein